MQVHLLCNSMRCMLLAGSCAYRPATPHQPQQRCKTHHYFCVHDLVMEVRSAILGLVRTESQKLRVAALE